MTYRLYGTPSSLYTGKARSYLIKQGVAFENCAPGEARFHEAIVPKIGRWIIPVLEAPDGSIVQDGSDIIAYFEAKGATRYPAYPATPRHRLIAQIFELFGGEGLLKPAMHYRWNFDATNRAFLARDFPSALAPTFAPEDLRAQVFEMASRRMRKAMSRFGVSDETIPAVEAAYCQFLDLFDAHLEASPYLLGGRPTIGDWGLIAPLYAHLARDPYPSTLMKQRAFRVWRWTERMNAVDQDAAEYGHPPAQLFADDAAPETLKALLRFIAEDYLPEIEAYVGFTNAWLAERPDIAPGTSGLDRTQERVIGEVEFDWRGHRVRVAVMPYRLYLLQKVQDVYDQAAPAAQVAMRALLDETGLAALLTLRTSRRVERVNHLEVWAAPPVG
ncbi:MAG: glutathione S-transferase C-terminal domain-containing protein [Hyphomonadaceae bacterium]|nr:glutathione S-transferase C-terminal domain-containing protein [Hyphomonadaceae bacterium]